MASKRDLAKRALVALVKFLAGIYSLTVDVKRESPDEEVRKAYRTLSRKVHPDKGGQKGEQEKLNAAYEERERERERGRASGVLFGLPFGGDGTSSNRFPGTIVPLGFQSWFFCENSHPLKSRVGSAYRFPLPPLES